MPTPKLSSSHLALVSNNLQNIYAAAHDVKKQTIELIPSLFGNYLYCPTVGWRGRILRLLHACIAIFAGRSFVQTRLSKAIQATQESFCRLEAFRRNYHDNIYQDYLNRRFNSLPSTFSKNEIDHARKEIKTFFQATYPLSQLVQSQKNDKLNAFLQVHFKSLFANHSTPFYCEETFKTVKDYIRIMAIEGFAGGELPLSIFRKKSVENQEEQEHDVSKVDEEALLSFIKKMHKAKKQGLFQVETFHKAMKSIIRYMRDHLDENAYDLKHLEQALIKEGCILLNEFDKKHVEWRQMLKKNDDLAAVDEPFYFLNDQHERFLFAIDDAIQGQENGDDHYKVYEIHDPSTLEKYQDLLMVVGPNKICLEYSDLMRSQAFWGLETPEIQFIHPKGKYAIVERLPHSIDSIDWKSESLGTLAEEDMKYADPLRLLIQFFIDEKNSPKDLKVEHLRFDALGRLKSIKDCVPCGHIDYIALEEMAFQLAQRENLPIYQHLIEPLREEKYAKRKLTPFFREALSSVFEKNVVSIEKLAKKRRINDQAVVKRAANLQHFAQKMKEDCYGIICQRYPSVDHEKLRTVMSKCLLRLYDNDKTFGRFWDNVRSEDLIEEVENDPEIHS